MVEYRPIKLNELYWEEDISEWHFYGKAILKALLKDKAAKLDLLSSYLTTVEVDCDKQTCCITLYKNTRDISKINIFEIFSWKEIFEKHSEVEYKWVTEIDCVNFIYDTLSTLNSEYSMHFAMEYSCRDLARKSSTLAYLQAIAEDSPDLEIKQEAEKLLHIITADFSEDVLTKDYLATSDISAMEVCLYQKGQNVIPYIRYMLSRERHFAKVEVA